MKRTLCKMEKASSKRVFNRNGSPRFTKNSRNRQCPCMGRLVRSRIRLKRLFKHPGTDVFGWNGQENA